MINQQSISQISIEDVFRWIDAEEEEDSLLISPTDRPGHGSG